MTDPLDFLFSLERLGMKFGLENMRTLCAALDHPESRFASVIVGGPTDLVQRARARIEALEHLWSRFLPVVTAYQDLVGENWYPHWFGDFDRVVRRSLRR